MRDPAKLARRDQAYAAANEAIDEHDPLDVADAALEAVRAFPPNGIDAVSAMLAIRLAQVPQ